MLSMEAVKVMSQLKELKTFSKTVFKTCVEYVAPRNLVDRELKVIDDQLHIRGEAIPLKNNVYLVGFGKAVLEMARTTETLIGSHLRNGILSVPEGTADLNPPQHSTISVYQGALNNLPDIKAETTSKRIAELIAPLKAEDVLIVLISGGGSALLPYPVPPVTLQEKRKLTESLAKSGANIIELNTIRKQLSMLKGGKLARLAYPSRVISLIISDVIGDNLDYIASGPTVPNTTATPRALSILQKYNLIDAAPKSIKDVINKEFPKDTPDDFKHTRNFIIGNNKMALRAGQELVEKGGHKCYMMTSSLEGSVTDVSSALCHLSTLICKIMARTINKSVFTEETKKLIKPLCLNTEALNQLNESLTGEPLDKVVLLFGGETTVRVTGKGTGGRNQELALRFSTTMDEICAHEPVTHLFNVVLLSAGTDGIDGPTDAAGAFGYIGQTEIAKQKNLNVRKFISDNNSYEFYSTFESGEDLIKIGHTGTNVMDIIMLTIQSKT